MRALKFFVSVRPALGVLCLAPWAGMVFLGAFSARVVQPASAPNYAFLALFFWLLGSLFVFAYMVVGRRGQWFLNVLGLVSWLILAQFVWSRTGSLPTTVSSINDLFSLWAFWLWPAATLLDLVVWIILANRKDWQGFAGGKYQA